MASLSDFSKLRGILCKAKNIVLTGAGISAKSKIPTFPGSGGFWGTYQSQDLATPGAFKRSPSLVWEFFHCRRCELVLTKPPNKDFAGNSPSCYHPGISLKQMEPLLLVMNSASQKQLEPLLFVSSTEPQKPAESAEGQSPGSGQPSSSGSTGGESNDGNKPLTNRQKLKLFMRDYGSTVIVFHVTHSLALLGVIYAAFSAGLDMAWVVKNLGLEGKSLDVAAGASTFVIAYAVNKVLAPLRFAITFAVTPFIVRYLRRVGFLKTPK